MSRDEAAFRLLAQKTCYIFEKITPLACVQTRKTDGGPAAEKVKEQIEELKQFAKNIK